MRAGNGGTAFDDDAVRVQIDDDIARFRFRPRDKKSRASGLYEAVGEFVDEYRFPVLDRRFHRAAGNMQKIDDEKFNGDADAQPYEQRNDKMPRFFFIFLHSFILICVRFYVDRNNMEIINYVGFEGSRTKPSVKLPFFFGERKNNLSFAFTHSPLAHSFAAASVRSDFSLRSFLISLGRSAENIAAHWKAALAVIAVFAFLSGAKATLSSLPAARKPSGSCLLKRCLRACPSSPPCAAVRNLSLRPRTVFWCRPKISPRLPMH